MTQTVAEPTATAALAGPAGPGRPALRQRLLGIRPTDRFWGWAAPLLVTALGGFLRFWHLDRPHKLVFDETYYVKEAQSYLRAGYELAINPDLKKPDDLWNAGNPNVFGTGPDFVVHPPLGKWMLAVGQWLFGADSSFGWRFGAAVVGTLSILILARIARRLFGSTLLGTTAGFLLAIDGQHFVHSRTGLLDIFVMFWALLAFGCLLIDRDRARARLASRVEAGAALTGWGPGLGLRPWRLAGAVCLGLTCGVKWSGLYFAAAFLLMSVLWDVAARRAAGVRHWFLGGLFRDGVLAGLLTVPVILVSYLATWIGWFVTSGGYDRQWVGQHPERRVAWLPDALRSLWEYHREMYHFHVNLHTTHAYQSNPWSWLVMGRPTAFFYEGYTSGQNGCRIADCSRAVTALGNPVIWWGGTVAIAVLVLRWALARDWRAGAILAGLVGGYLPWFQYQERTIYTFYAVAFVPWVVLALTYCLGWLLGPSNATPERRTYGAMTAGAIVLTAVLAFAFFYPIWSAQLISRGAWSARMWLPSWI